MMWYGETVKAKGDTSHRVGGGNEIQVAEMTEFQMLWYGQRVIETLGAG